jgi:ribosomal protein S18 acetylase RimI-like enzyme
VRKLELMARDSNAAVVGFYEHIGYEREPVVVMSRWLDGTRR